MSTTKVLVNKRRFVTLLQHQLQYRWLSDRTIVYNATVKLFYRRKALHRDFVSQIMDANQSGKISSAKTKTSHLRHWISCNKSIKLLFRNRDSVPVPSELIEAVDSKLAYRWAVPRIDSIDQLCDFLCLAAPRVLDWLTLPHCRLRTSVEHYRRVPRRKRDGSVRWIEQPAPTLKRVQRLIAQELLPIIPLHDAAFGFRRGRSPRLCAEPHVGKALVIRMDLKDFFASIHFGRVRALFELAGYPLEVANRLAQLCVAVGIPDRNLDLMLQRSRLPQGAPTSPGLANAIAFRLDRRIAGLSESTGMTYTRYADDLIFSSNEMRLTHAKIFATTVAVIAMEEGFDVNFRKTSFARYGSRQHVLGFTVNEQCNTPRAEYERLKAILHNCQHRGPESQNRSGHPRFKESLRGRITHVTSVNPKRGEKLMRIYDQITW